MEARSLNIVVLSLLAVALCSCAGNSKAGIAFDSADSLMQSRPDSALSILRSVARASLSSRSDIARYSLLMSQALDKNYIDLTTDSLIRPAVAYYDKKGTDHDRALSHYYLARVNENAGINDEAVEEYVVAKQYVHKDDYYLYALICQNFGNQYRTQFEMEKALPLFKEAEDAYRQLGLQSKVANMMKSEAEMYLDLREYDRSMQHYNDALNLYTSIMDTSSILTLSSSIAYAEYLQGEKSISSIESELLAAYSKYNGGKMPPEDYTVWSEFYLKQSKVDSARLLELAYSAFRKGDAAPRQMIGQYLLLENIEKQAGNYSQALKYIDRSFDLLDSVSNAETAHKVSVLEKKYENKLLQDKNQLLVAQRKRQAAVFSLIIVALLAVTVILLLLIRYRRKKYESMLDSLTVAQEDIQSKYEALNLAKTMDDEHERRCLIALDKHLKDISLLLDSAYMYDASKFRDDFAKYAKASPNDKQAFADLRYFANKKCNGVIDFLQAKYHSLTIYDLDLCSLISLGFNSEGIRWLYGFQSSDSYYNKCSRLRKKLNLPQNVRLNDFLKEAASQLGPC